MLPFLRNSELMEKTIYIGFLDFLYLVLVHYRVMVALEKEDAGFGSDLVVAQSGFKG